MNAPIKTQGMFTDEDFDKSLLPTYLKKDVREVIEVAVMLGWKMHISGANSVTIIAPEERKKYHFSCTGRASNSITRIRKDVMRFADPQKLLLADSIAGIKDDSLLADRAMALLPALGDEGTVVDHRAEEAAAAAERAARKAVPKPKPPTVPTVAVSDGNQPSAVPQGVSPRNEERHIVSTRAMLAKASRGRGYTSETTLEREWSDGTKDYKCRYQGCDYTSENRGSVPAHYAKSHSIGLADRPVVFPAEVPEARQYAPRQTRIDALAGVINNMLRGNNHIEPHEIARTALTWVHEQSRSGSEHSEEREPKTAEEVLNRIKNLLDRGETAVRIGQMQQQLAELEVGLIEAEERAEQAEKRADQARSTLRAFMELARDLDPEEESA